MYEYKYQLAIDTTRSQSESFEVTFKPPCYCSTYAIAFIDDVVHKFTDQAIEVPVEQAVCTGDSVNCLLVSAFSYKAK